jgi:hypothetical protein
MGLNDLGFYFHWEQQIFSSPKRAVSLLDPPSFLFKGCRGSFRSHEVVDIKSDWSYASVLSLHGMDRHNFIVKYKS